MQRLFFPAFWLAGCALSPSAVDEPATSSGKGWQRFEAIQPVPAWLLEQFGRDDKMIVSMRTAVPVSDERDAVATFWLHFTGAHFIVAKVFGYETRPT